MEQYILPIATAVIGIAGTLLAIWYKHKLDLDKLEEDHECPIGVCVHEDELVIEKLREILNVIRADRISIFSFHNGGTYYSGKSMQKMSMSYEEIDNGISSTMMAKQNIPVSACITTLKPLMENGEFWCIDTKDYPEGLCKHHLNQEGVKSTYNWPIIDLHNNIIGVLRVDYVKRKTRISDEDHELLKQLALQLPGYLASKII
tara:strand:+ start:414 stop:1022 length:609 start_codon:yes stop_codon:yes gene_type:complete